METELVKLIQTIGFPMAMCVWFMWQQNKTLAEFREVIENNTKALTQLLTVRGAD